MAARNLVSREIPGFDRYVVSAVLRHGAVLCIYRQFLIADPRVEALITYFLAIDCHPKSLHAGIHLSRFIGSLYLQAGVVLVTGIFDAIRLHGGIGLVLLDDGNIGVCVLRHYGIGHIVVSARAEGGIIRLVSCSISGHSVYGSLEGDLIPLCQLSCRYIEDGFIVIVNFYRRCQLLISQKASFLIETYRVHAGAVFIVGGLYGHLYLTIGKGLIFQSIVISKSLSVNACYLDGFYLRLLHVDIDRIVVSGRYVACRVNGVYLEHLVFHRAVEPASLYLEGVGAVVVPRGVQPALHVAAAGQHRLHINSRHT